MKEKWFLLFSATKFWCGLVRSNSNCNDCLKQEGYSSTTAFILVGRGHERQRPKNLTKDIGDESDNRNLQTLLSFQYQWSSPPLSVKTRATLLKDNRMTYCTSGRYPARECQFPSYLPLPSLTASIHVSRLLHEENHKVLLFSIGENLGSWGKGDSKGERP